MQGGSDEAAVHGELKAAERAWREASERAAPAAELQRLEERVAAARNAVFALGLRDGSA